MGTVLSQRRQGTYGDVYLTNIYGRKNVDAIEQHDPEAGPLFLFASFNAGHDPLQALDTDFDDCDAEVSPGSCPLFPSP